MSYRAVAWAGSISGLKPPEAFVLARIADQASDEGFCAISYRSLAETTRYNRRHVIRIVQRLRERRLLIMEDQHNAKSLHLPKRIVLNFEAGGGSDKMSLAQGGGSDKMSPAGSDNLSLVTFSDLKERDYHATDIKDGCQDSAHASATPPARPDRLDGIIDYLTDGYRALFGEVAINDKPRIEILAKEIARSGISKEWVSLALDNTAKAGARKPWAYFEAVVRGCIRDNTPPGSRRLSRGGQPAARQPDIRPAGQPAGNQHVVNEPAPFEFFDPMPSMERLKRRRNTGT